MPRLSPFALCLSLSVLAHGALTVWMSCGAAAAIRPPEFNVRLGVTTVELRSTEAKSRPVAELPQLPDLTPVESPAPSTPPVEPLEFKTPLVARPRSETLARIEFDPALDIPKVAPPTPDLPSFSSTEFVPKPAEPVASLNATPERTRPKRPLARPKHEPQAQLETITELADVTEPARVGSSANQAAQVARLPSKLPDNPAPPYPEAALREGKEGRVILRVKVSATGTVTDIGVHKSSGVSSLDEAALQTVKTWKFSPALRGNERIEYEVAVPISFNLNNRIVPTQP
jgi:periplasmic protein TonB